MTTTVTVNLADLEKMMGVFAGGTWNRVDNPDIADAWQRLTEAKDAALGLAETEAHAPAEPPPLPPGDYGTVHVMGHEQREGWVTDGSIAGAACLDVRDEAGRLIAKIPPHSVYMFEPGFPPQVLARMGAPLAALPAGPLPAHHFDERYDEDDEPAGEFAGHVDPGADF